MRFYEHPRNGPSTHALVIGVGGYDHLEGGMSAAKLERATRYGNLGQLTSPPKSAWEFANFLASVAEDWVAPLGTIDLLISTVPSDDAPGGNAGRYERPTRPAIQAAFDSWWRHCATNAENVAVFYFCGHGMQAGNQLLLASDFGATGNPWSQAIDFNKTRSAFNANPANTQVFLVDACREITTSNVEVPNPSAPPLREPEQRQAENCEHDLTIQATSRSERAYAKEGEISYFTRAVIEALAGAVARKQNGDWWVRTDRIASTISDLVARAGGPKQRPVVTTSTPTRLRRLPFTPAVTLEFGCLPDEATAAADLTYHELPSGALTQRPDRSRAPWCVVVPAALYQIEARFPDGSFTDAKSGIAAEPPTISERLAVR